jgi:hypothetical protein
MMELSLLAQDVPSYSEVKMLRIFAAPETISDSCNIQNLKMMGTVYYLAGNMNIPM